MNKLKLLSGILCICLVTPLFQQSKAEATRNRMIEEMKMDSFVVIDEQGNPHTIDLADITSETKEISVEDKYEVIDNVGGEVVETCATEEEAIEVAQTSEEELVVQPFSLRSIETGVVYINTNTSTGYAEYTNVATGQSGYIAGAFGRDAAYIGEFNGKIRAKVAGVIADFNPGDVDVRNANETKTSYYIEEDGYLVHYYLFGSELVYGRTRVGYDLDYLETGVKYYSYDGHYFYDTYEKMVKDYKNGTYANAINPNNPHYNYYQYLSHRALSSVSADVIDDYTLRVVKTQAAYESCKMYEIGQVFIDSQNKYTVNASLMYGVAVNESDFGRSGIARDKNNLFGHSAYDENPYDGADYYATVQDSVDAHAYRFISRGYLDYSDWRHNGPHVGDKEGGINVRYASDPYWGEKAACRPYYFDELPEDYATETIGIIEGSFSACKLYKEADASSTVITTLTNLSNYPVLILDEVEANGQKWYKIASDTPLIDNRTKHDYSLIYNSERDYVYIQADKVQVVWNEKVEEQPTTPSTPTLEEGHQIKFEENMIIAQTKTTVADIKKIDANAVIKNQDTKITDANALVGTGYTVTINNQTYSIVKLGDANGDGKINSGDLFATQKYLLGKSSPRKELLIAMDANRDGKINSGDLFVIQKHLIKNTEFSL